MKRKIICIISILIFTLSNTAFSQTVDEIISKYLNAIGGKDQLNKIFSLYTESKTEIAGIDVVIRETLLNGKGYKSEIDFGPLVVLTECFTDVGGWIINPFSGNNDPKVMTASQYNAGKDQIYIGGAPFTKYKEMGYKAELVGHEKLGEVNTYKIKLTTQKNLTSFHYFDSATGYLIKSVIQEDALGQKVEIVKLYSDYKIADGIRIPYKVTIFKNEGALEIPGTVSKVEVNKPLDISLFEKSTTKSEQPVYKEVTSAYNAVYENIAPGCGCQDLLKVEIPNTKIESAIIEPRDSSCRVKAIVTHPPFNDKVTVTIALPLKNWNGRFMGSGGGGFVGGSVYSLNQPVSQGFAAGVTDGGHEGGRGSFAYNQEKDCYDWQSIRNFSHVAMHDMTTFGKKIIQAFYGKPARYSYFVGGSNGGRQAMEEVQRYPEDYDGVIAMCPAIYWNHFLLEFIWSHAVMNDAGNLVSREKLKAVTEAVVAACDGDDGLLDGVIEDPFSCKWDPKEFVGTKVGESVFTEADANVVRKIWEGPRGTDGRFLWYGLTKGSNLLDYANTKENPLTVAPNDLVVDWARYFLLLNPDYDGKSITCNEYERLFVQSVDQYSSIFETSNTDLTAFRDHDSKLIITHGLSDNMIPPQGTIKYYKLLQEKMGGPKATSKFARLFLYPGLDHGFMGSGPKTGSGDLLDAMIQWVEKGKTPKYLEAVAKKNTFGDVIRKTSIYPFGKQHDK